ncbi:hypothetical protein D3C81_1412040 [compost metagenome]
MTMNPLPAAPARTASIEAFSARILVCLLTAIIGLRMLRIKCVLSWSIAEFCWISSIICTVDSLCVTRFFISSAPWSLTAITRSAELSIIELILATSLILPPISSTLRLLLSASAARLAAPSAISPVAAATSLAWVEVAPEALTSCSEVASTSVADNPL